MSRPSSMNVMRFCYLLVLFSFGCLFGADPAPESPGESGAPEDILKDIPRSTFAVDAKGRDPFNPKELPFQGQQTTTQPVPSPVNPEETIDFKGITGTGANRVALINTVPMRAGETEKIRGSDNVVREWKLVEIFDEEVVLEFQGKTYRKRLEAKYLQLNTESRK